MNNTGAVLEELAEVERKDKWIDAEEQFLGLLEKSVNGGGANHSVLEGTDDFFAQFFNEIK